MKNLVIFLSSMFAGLWFGTAHAGNDAAAGNYAQAVTPQRGALYRLRHQNNTAYLFGTIHVGMPDFYPLEEQVTRALADASKLVLEVDIRDPGALQQALHKHGMYAQNDSVERHLSASTLARLKQTLQRYKVPFEHVRRMKPWMLTNMLMSLDLARSGYHHSLSVEHFLLSSVHGKPKTVHGLESAEYQMSLFDSMNDTMQEQYLLEQLVELDDGNTIRRAQGLIDAWARADNAAVEKMMRDSLLEKSISSEFTQRVLLDRRNPRMADKIEVLLRNDASTFVGIGLLHLIGEGSVPALLRQRGYAVERLY